MLDALIGCIDGHESLYTQAGMLQRDISMNNLIMNEDDNNPSWRSFLRKLLGVVEGEAIRRGEEGGH